MLLLFAKGSSGAFASGPNGRPGPRTNMYLATTPRTPKDKANTSAPLAKAVAGGSRARARFVATSFTCGQMTGHWIDPHRSPTCPRLDRGRSSECVDRHPGVGRGPHVSSPLHHTTPSYAYPRRDI